MPLLDAAGGAVTLENTTRQTPPAQPNGSADTDAPSGIIFAPIGQFDRQANPPSFDPLGGTYDAPVVVTLTSLEPGATIHYSLDGNVPSPDSPIYTTPIEISETTTIFAQAYHPDYIPSAIMMETYRIVTQTEPERPTLPDRPADLFNYLNGDTPNE